MQIELQYTRFKASHYLSIPRWKGIVFQTWQTNPATLHYNPWH